MKVLIIGNGGRENAIKWKIQHNNNVKVCETIDYISNTQILKLCKDKLYDLVVVGPEKPLSEGVVDFLKNNNILVFGPSKSASALESSKIFAKKFMNKYNIKTADYKEFSDITDAKNHICKVKHPVVIKADGLAAGKGVVISHSVSDSVKTINDFMDKMIFAHAGKKIIVEEYLTGFEVSMLCITDGKVIVPFISSMDYKKIGDGNTGLNTGGMGAVSPSPFFNNQHFETFKNKIMYPTLTGIKNEKFDYNGIIYIGLMITDNDMYVLEYNVRMGDPETQAVLPLMKSDFLDLILNSLKGKLQDFNIEWFKNKYSCCVVSASKGYPLEYEKDKIITGLDKVKNNLFLSGVYKKDNNYFTNSGRVFSINSVSDSLKSAVKNCYDDLNNIHFDGIYYRRDIGLFT